jgi:hypothetical protein
MTSDLAEARRCVCVCLCVCVCVILGVCVYNVYMHTLGGPGAVGRVRV